MPDAVLVEIAAALAAKAAESLYDFVKDRFKGRKKALAVLEAADGAAPESSQVLALADELQNGRGLRPGVREAVRCPTVPGQASIRMFIRKGTGINCQADQNISLQNSRSKP